jgi:hypothetical protein
LNFKKLLLKFILCNGKKFTTNGKVRLRAVEVISVVPSPITELIVDALDDPLIVKFAILFVKVNFVVMLLYVMEKLAGINNRS